MRTVRAKKTPAKRNSQALNESPSDLNYSNSSKKTRLLSPERTSSSSLLVKLKKSPRSGNRNENAISEISTTPKGDDLNNKKIHTQLKSPRLKNKNDKMSVYTVNFNNKNIIRKLNNSNNNIIIDQQKPYKLPVEKKVLEISEEEHKIENVCFDTSKENSSEMMDIENDLQCCSNYFRHRSHGKLKSSGRKFIDMSLDLNKINMNDVDMGSDAENLYLKKYQDQYELWKLYQIGGFNILFYGLGCKLSLLRDFCESLDNTDILFIQNIPSISVKDIIIKTAKYILNDDIKYNDQFFKKTSMQEVINCISKDKSNRCLYIAINNIDRQNWREQRDQNWLSSLGTCENIRLIATVDHINAAALWDTLQFYKFRWMTIEIMTYQSLSIDTLFMNNNMGKIEYVSYESALAVYSAVPFNAKQVFILIAKRQIDKTLPNFNFKELKLECSKKSLANSDLSLKSHLRQFLDHKIMELNDNDNTYLIRLLDEDIKKLIELKK